MNNRPLLWVDGYNVIFADPALAELARQNIHSAVQALIERVAEYAAAKEYEPVVFLDNKTSHVPIKDEEFLGVRVISGNTDNSADELMEKMNYDLDKQRSMVLITSDRLVRQMIGHRTAGSRHIEAGEFVQEFNKMRQALGKNIPRDNFPFKLFHAVSGTAKDLLNKLRHGAQ